jgi:acyl-CoA thioester hydrolase
MSEPRTRHTSSLRVYWEDTDAGGVVYHANYLKFFERARTDWLRALGVGQERLLAESNRVFVVAQVALRYLAPARLDDMVDVSVALAALGGASLELLQRATRDGLLLVEGSVRIGCVEAGTLRPRRIPNAILERLA